jgi:hypothetical protein
MSLLRKARGKVLGGFKGSNGLERFREVQGGLGRFRGVVRGFKGFGV